MSIARQLLREVRPLFHMFEEPFGRAPAAYGFPHRSMLDHPFLQSPAVSRPAIDLTDEGDNYVVEADLPGVKKDNVEVRVGDGGHSITIEGKVVTRSDAGGAREGDAGSANASAATGGGEDSTNVSTESANKISTERFFSGASIFTRTVWLPQPVDPSKVQAKLSDGILTLKVPKKEEDSVKVEVQ